MSEALQSTAVYLDCNASTPIDPEIKEVFIKTLEHVGNPASRHVHGVFAARLVARAREEVAALLAADPSEVFFTSGTTESCNLALQGLAPYGEKVGRRHLIVSAVEHPAILEPARILARQGFSLVEIPPTSGGWVDPEAVRRELRSDTLMVAVQGANHETGVVHPLHEIATVLGDHPAFFVVDAAQALGKEVELLRNPRIDAILASAHKLYAPCGVGVLVWRRRTHMVLPLAPLLFGGGQEQGLRPGSLPTALIAAFGAACRIALRDHAVRREANYQMRQRLLNAFAPLSPNLHGDPERCQPHVANLSFPGIDAQAALIALKDLISCSTGSACSSGSHKPSPVLTAMGLPPQYVRGALRWSWCHLTPDFDPACIIERLQRLR